jgi:hypothetical protein
MKNPDNKGKGGKEKNAQANNNEGVVPAPVFRSL